MVVNEERLRELEEKMEKMKSLEEGKKKTKSHWIWYLLPVLLGLIGGIIGFFIFRKKDKSKALTLLGIGIIITTILFFI